MRFFFTVVFVLMIVMNVILTQSKPHLGSRANLRPQRNADDNVERNTDKLMVVFNGTCVNSADAVELKIQALLKEYQCLAKWHGVYRHSSNTNLRGIYEQADGDYHAYFTFNEAQTDEISCIDSIHIEHQEFCIKMIDYEVVLKSIGCLTGSVYSAPLSSYYRWHLDKIDGATDSKYMHLDTAGVDGNVDIYILDSGILNTHTELSSVKSYTLMDPSYSTPQTGHGTHVAGIAVGKTCGVTNHAVYDYPVCRGSTEACYTSYIEDAFAAILSRLNSTKRRGVINMSFGTSTMPSSYYISWYDSYLSQLVNLGAIPVAAAGNDAQDACISYPAASSYAFSIGSHDSSYNSSTFTNYGSCVDIHAPGDSVLSSWYTSTTSYAMASGTSMATPMVTGIVADLLWRDNTLTYNQIKSIIQSPSNNVAMRTCRDSTYPCKALKLDCSTVYTPKPTTANTLAPTTLKPTTAGATTLAPTTLRPTTAGTTTPKPTSKPTPKPVFLIQL